jgi:hypothetical protein
MRENISNCLAADATEDLYLNSLSLLYCKMINYKSANDISIAAPYTARRYSQGDHVLLVSALLLLLTTSQSIFSLMAADKISMLSMLF